MPLRRPATTYPNRNAGSSDQYNSNSPETVARTDYAGNLGPELPQQVGEPAPACADKFTQWCDGPNPADADKNLGFVDQRFNQQQRNGGVFFQRHCLNFKEITDGVSNTYLIGEKYLQPRLYETNSSTEAAESNNDDQGVWIGDDLDNNRNTELAPAQDQDGLKILTIFGSAHSGGLNMTFCDASVHVISYDIDATTHKWLGHRSDGETLPSTY